MDIYINQHTLLALGYSVINIVVMSIIAILVYRRDPNSVLNKIFSIGATSMAISYVFFPLGGLFWDLFVFDIRLIYITTRYYLFFLFLSIMFLCWCAVVTYFGEQSWNDKRNIFFFSVIFIIFCISLFSPGSIIILSPPPEIDTGKSISFSLVFLPSILFFIFAGIIHFWIAYFEFHEEEDLIKRQAFILAIGTSIAGTAIIPNVIALVTKIHFFNYIEYLLITVGLIVMSFGFSQEASLIDLKITSDLYRIKFNIEKGNFEKAKSYLHHLKNLVTSKEGLTRIQIKTLFLEGLILSQTETNINSAKRILDEAYELARKNNEIDLQNEIREQLDYLKLQKQTIEIYETIKDTKEQSTTETDLRTIINYLDSLIDEQKTIFHN